MRLLVLTLCLAAGLASAQAADQPFAARLIVDDRPITNFEVEQRVALLKVLRTPGDPTEEALNGLIEDRLRVVAAGRLGLTATEEMVTAGIDEFASRANLSGEAFLDELAKAGVEETTLRDFVRAGILWRDLVRERFGGLVVISNSEIDRELSVTSRRTEVSILLSEFVIPVAAGSEQEIREAMLDLRSRITSEADFALAAERYSASPSAPDGGRLEWKPLAQLPSEIGTIVAGMSPGQVSEPVEIPNALALFLLRGREERAVEGRDAVTVEYAQLLLAETAETDAEVARIRAMADTCADLYGAIKGQPADRLQIVTESAGAVPRDIAGELARMDAGESSAALRRGGNRLFLMLCARNALPEPPPTREQVRTLLLNRALTGLADGYLAELRAAAIIREP